MSMPETSMLECGNEDVNERFHREETGWAVATATEIPI
jgi:hypothetical protein